MGRRRKIEENTVEMDLTPMIDVVFQLMIFFMIVTDMNATDYIELVLPITQSAKKPDVKEKHVIVINITNQKPRGKYVFRFRDKQMQTYDKLFKHLQATSISVGKEAGGFSKLKVLIRCDKAVEYGAVQDIFKACAKNKITKVAIAANEPSK